MKEIDELQIPTHVRFAESHEWVQGDGDKLRVGISDYAQDQLGDIVFVELPQAGDTLERGQEFGTVESVKAVSELYMPVGGEILRVNTALEDAPELVNKQPYDEGWMIEIKPTDAGELERLKDHRAYLEMLKGQE